jgi:hypothetical protein
MDNEQSTIICLVVQRKKCYIKKKITNHKSNNLFVLVADGYKYYLK